MTSTVIPAKRWSCDANNLAGGINSAVDTMTRVDALRRNEIASLIWTCVGSGMMASMGNSFHLEDSIQRGLGTTPQTWRALDSRFWRNSALCTISVTAGDSQWEFRRRSATIGIAGVDSFGITRPHCAMELSGQAMESAKGIRGQVVCRGGDRPVVDAPQWADMESARTRW